MLRIAIQSKGRLSDDSLALLRDAGIMVDELKRKFLGKASNFPLELLYLRDDDIPGVVADGCADIGIVGFNEVAESGLLADGQHDQREQHQRRRPEEQVALVFAGLPQQPFVDHDLTRSESYTARILS